MKGIIALFELCAFTGVLVFAIVLGYQLALAMANRW